MKLHTRLLTTAGSALASVFSYVQVAAAQVFNGPGIEGAIDQANGIVGLPSGDVRTTIIRIVQTVLSFLALAAVITIIIAGIWLIVGMGSDESRERAKKIILYTLVGLIIVLFARVIVGLVTVFLASQIA